MMVLKALSTPMSTEAVMRRFLKNLRVSDSSDCMLFSKAWRVRTKKWGKERGWGEGGG